MATDTPRRAPVVTTEDTSATETESVTILPATEDVGASEAQRDVVVTGSAKLSLRTIGRDTRVMRLATTIREVSVSLDVEQLWEQLDTFKEDVASTLGNYTLTIGATTGVAALAAAGYTVWVVRGGFLVASFVSSLPAWSSIDPLPILACQSDGRRKRQNQPEDTESLQSMVGLGTQQAPQTS